MEESRTLILKITFRSGRTLGIEVTQNELDWLFDRMFGRTEGNFSNFSGAVVNVNDIESLRYEEAQYIYIGGE